MLLFLAFPASAACVDASGGGAGVNGGCVSGGESKSGSTTDSADERMDSMDWGDLKELIDRFRS